MRTPWFLLLCVACGPEQPGDVPLGGKALQTWLEDGEYTGWAAEPEVHDGAGPHFGAVRVFVNPDLEASLLDGNTEHPIGSSSVKELYGSGDSVLGWAVMTKIESGTSGDTWHWYERYEDDTLIDGVGKPDCSGCHGAGIDHVLTEWPGAMGSR